MLRLIVFGVVCVVALPAWADKPAAGKLSFAQGGVFRAEKEEGPYRRISEGGDVFEGDFIKTEAESRAEARLEDRSVIRIGAESRVMIQKAQFNKKDETKQVQVKLVVGRFWAKVTKLFGASSFDVETPNAVAGVRGTAFAVDQGADKSTTVRVFNGKVLISNRPIYMTQEPPKKTEGPPGKKERKQVAGPQEVSKKQWEEMVAQALQQVKVAANGQMSQEQFAADDAAKDEWVAWNRGRDGKDE
ncbi:MAG: FecR domain-containing protein [Deltaproteobacteria bacterium]|nr:FecR domain-containing protein [Deltaproteobacteria bacterium]